MGIASARRAPPELVCLALAALALGGALGCKRRHQPTAPEASAVPPGAVARLSGQVVDGRAHAVPEARVLAFRLTQPDSGAGNTEPARATADLEGRFTIEGLTAGSYRLLVEAAGAPRASVTRPMTRAPRSSSSRTGGGCPPEARSSTVGAWRRTYPALAAVSR